MISTLCKIVISSRESEIMNSIKQNLASLYKLREEMQSYFVREISI